MAETKHPNVEGFAYPESARAAGDSTEKADPVPTVVQTATPGIAAAVADIDAEREDPEGAEAKRNARERALAGHVAPDTVDLPEAKLRADDNEAAAKGLRPDDAARQAADAQRKATAGRTESTPTESTPAESTPRRTESTPTESTPRRTESTPRRVAAK